MHASLLDGSGAPVGGTGRGAPTIAPLAVRSRVENGRVGLVIQLVGAACHDSGMHFSGGSGRASGDFFARALEQTSCGHMLCILREKELHPWAVAFLSFYQI